MQTTCDPATPADLIESQASAYEAEVLARSGSVLTVALDLRLSDGRRVPYRLHIDAADAVVRVREDATLRLPAECFERHIVPDGWFCMNHPDADPLEVTDFASASRWWVVLLGYLRRQERAAKSGRWPGQAWAHGVAAKAQWAAENAASALGAGFVSALATGTLSTVRPKRRKEVFIELHCDGRRVYSVWIDERRVATQRQQCLCGSGLALASCGDHAVHAAELALQLSRWRADEERFWSGMKGRPCCGTMKNCPLNIINPINDAAAPPSAAAA